MRNKPELLTIWQNVRIVFKQIIVVQILKRESELIFTSSYEGVYLKPESSNNNRIRMPGGQVKPNVISFFDE